MAEYKTSELIEYLNHLEFLDGLGILMNFVTPDRLKLAEIKNRLLELEKIEKYGGKRFYVEPTEIITKEGRKHFREINKEGV